MKTIPGNRYAFNVYFSSSRYTIGNRYYQPLLLLLPPNSTLVNFFPSPTETERERERNIFRGSTDQKRPTITRCIRAQVRESRRREGRKGRSRFNCFADEKRKKALPLLVSVPLRGEVRTRTSSGLAKFRGCKYWPIRRIALARQESGGIPRVFEE